MKKIVVASDSFKGSVSSREVADFVETAVHRVFPKCEVVKIPIADGGEGTVDALTHILNGTKVKIVVHDPLMRLIEVEYGILGDGETAVMEMAAASGLTLVSKEERNPLITTTFGTGEMIRDALLRGCRKFLIGIGGSATNDAGVGMLQALGFRFYNAFGEELRQGGEILSQIKKIDESGVILELSEASFTVACDVNNPFYGHNGASYVFAKQKGANDAMVIALDNGLRNFARIVKENRKIDLQLIHGSGAAGGLGGGLVSFLQADLKPGIFMVLEALSFNECIKGADLIITGEGKLDNQTCMGKTPYGVLKVAQKEHIPVIAIGGSVENEEVLKQEGFLAVLSIVPYPISLKEALNKKFTADNIIRTIENQMRIIKYFSL